jgi:hypothetical protein
MQTFVVKTEAVDFYQHTGVSLDLNPFSFNAGAEGIVTAGYHQTQGHGQVHTAGGGSGYRDAGVVFCGTEPSVMAHPGVHGPSGGAFAEDCGFYH